MARGKPFFLLVASYVLGCLGIGTKFYDDSVAAVDMDIVLSSWHDIAQPSPSHTVAALH
jgi:hypothetical protein